MSPFVALLASLPSLALDAVGPGRRLRACEARWTPVLLDAFGGDADPGALHALVRGRDQARYLGFLAVYARVVGGEGRPVLAAAAAPFLDTAEALLRHPDAAARARGVEWLGALGGPAHRHPLAAALGDSDPAPALAAARALARSGDVRYAPAILNALDRLGALGRADLSEASAAALALFGLPLAPALTAAFADDRRPAATRAAAATALRRLGYAPAAEAAAALLEMEPALPRAVAAAALRLLRDFGRAEHVLALRPLCEATDPGLRGLARRARISLRRPASAPAPRLERARQAA